MQALAKFGMNAYRLRNDSVMSPAFFRKKSDSPRTHVGLIPDSLQIQPQFCLSTNNAR